MLIGTSSSMAPINLRRRTTMQWAGSTVHVIQSVMIETIRQHNFPQAKRSLKEVSPPRRITLGAGRSSTTLRCQTNQGKGFGSRRLSDVPSAE